jgi:hypothetical protein
LSVNSTVERLKLVFFNLERQSPFSSNYQLQSTVALSNAFALAIPVGYCIDNAHSSRILKNHRILPGLLLVASVGVIKLNRKQHQ